MHAGAELTRARGRLPSSAHYARPWRIHQLARDFHLEDVWALPAEGTRDEFPRLVRAIAAEDPADGGGDASARAARALWWIRLKLGEVLGLDDPDSGVGARVPTLRERLPEDLLGRPAGPDLGSSPAFTSVYLLGDEWAAELANRTVHGVLHLGWVPVAGDEDGGASDAGDGDEGASFDRTATRYRGQLAILVKPNGLGGRAYMAAIRPFRHLIVYPAMLRRIERAWAGAAGENSR